MIVPGVGPDYSRWVQTSRTSILIIGPAGRWRSSVCVLLQADPDIQMVHQSDDGVTGLECIAGFRPAIVLVDGGLEGEEAWLTLQHIQVAWPQVRCVILAHDSTQARRAASSGADAVLQVGFSGETLYATLRRLLA